MDANNCARNNSETLTLRYAKDTHLCDPQLAGQHCDDELKRAGDGVARWGLNHRRGGLTVLRGLGLGWQWRRDSDRLCAGSGDGDGEIKAVLSMSLGLLRSACMANARRCLFSRPCICIRSQPMPKLHTQSLLLLSLRHWHRAPASSKLRREELAARPVNSTNG